MLGTTLAGHYQIVRHLGGGGFSQTFIAEDQHLPGKPTCIIKQLKPASAREGVLKIARDLFDKEAKVLYRLGRHDRIPSLLAHFEQDEEFFLAQEMVEGHVLSQEIHRHQCFNEDYVIALLSDLMITLDFVHKQQVIHRDIKPSNLIRRKQDGKIVLIDFGAVKEVSTQTISVDNPDNHSYSGLVIGSPGYMPNEQYGGRSQFASDIYAVGVICIQALTGLTATEIPEDQKTSEFVWRDHVTASPALLDVIDKMVRFDWRQRYQTALEVLHAVQQIAPIVANSEVTNQAAISPFLNDSLPSQPSVPTRPKEATVLGLGSAPESNQSISTEKVCEELEKFEDLVRAKKLLCLVCTGILENDINRLNNFTLAELVEDIYDQNPTPEQLKNSLVESVKILNVSRRKQYLYIAKIIFNAVVKLYENPDFRPSSKSTQSFSQKSLDTQARLKSPYFQVSQELESDSNHLRIKKLILYACRDVWEHDVNRLNQIELVDLLTEIIEFTPTLRQLEASLFEVVNTLSKPIEYSAIVNIIIDKLQKVYSLNQDVVATNLHVNSKNDLVAAELPMLAPDYEIQAGFDDKQKFNLDLLADLFDLRLELIRFANPLRTKILLFSTLHYPFFIGKNDWSDIRTQTLDNLLRALFCSYPTEFEAEKKLIQVAHSLEEPEQYGQVIRYIVRAVKPLYSKLTELSMRHPLEEQRSFSGQNPSSKTSIHALGNNKATHIHNNEDEDDQTCRFI
ncbi:serine/threonine-protein kinase [Tumidithrix elongata RA019]|uniref:non-specific serine/threonine protein kinase n=1 Tax=Tumidithrix elongata BACA0141 TaxID=2716417 RepID=A0AAW9PWD7_9CYAN|nr:serine/threonine-protein kinase [Tumidithrix elongata RA019]